MATSGGGPKNFLALLTINLGRAQNYFGSSIFANKLGGGPRGPSPRSDTGYCMILVLFDVDFVWFGRNCNKYNILFYKYIHLIRWFNIIIIIRADILHVG